jgi:hypothetical protein
LQFEEAMIGLNNHVTTLFGKQGWLRSSVGGEEIVVFRIKQVTISKKYLVYTFTTKGIQINVFKILCPQDEVSLGIKFALTMSGNRTKCKWEDSSI